MANYSIYFVIMEGIVSVFLLNKAILKEVVDILITLVCVVVRDIVINEITIVTRMTHENLLAVVNYWHVRQVLLIVDGS